MKYKKQVFFILFCFLVFNGSYMFLTWNSNQPSLEDYYEVRLFIDAGETPTDWYLRVKLYDEVGKLYGIAVSSYYSKSSCYVVVFALHYTISFEPWSIQGKNFTAFEYGNESRRSFSFIVESTDWQAGNGSSWAQWFQSVETEAYSVCVALGPYYEPPILTRYQLAELLNINFHTLMFGVVFFLGHTYGKEEASK